MHDKGDYQQPGHHLHKTVDHQWQDDFGNIFVHHQISEIVAQHRIHCIGADKARKMAAPEITNSRFQLLSANERSHSGRLSVGIGSGSIKITRILGGKYHDNYTSSMQLPDLSSTIIALATPPGVGAIGVIRLSGPRAIIITDNFQGEKTGEISRASTAHFGKIVADDGRFWMRYW